MQINSVSFLLTHLSFVVQGFAWFKYQQKMLSKANNKNPMQKKVFDHSKRVTPDLQINMRCCQRSVK